MTNPAIAWQTKRALPIANPKCPACRNFPYMRKRKGTGIAIAPNANKTEIKSGAEITNYPNPARSSTGTFLHVYPNLDL